MKYSRERENATKNIVTWGKKTPQGTKKFPFKKRVPANITAKELLGLAHGNTYKLIQSH